MGNARSILRTRDPHSGLFMNALPEIHPQAERRLLTQQPDNECTEYRSYPVFYTAHIIHPPASASVREHMDLWPIFDQGTLGSCTANAIAAAIEFETRSADFAIDGLAETFSSSEAFVPSRLFIYYNEREREGTIDSDAGAQTKDGIKTVQRIGFCSESLRLYQVENFNVQPPISCYESTHLVTGAHRLFPQNLSEMKKAIATGYPVVFGVAVYETFLQSQDGNIPMPDTVNEKLQGGHAILAVAYDDLSMQVTFRNSWGAEWGDGGYGKLPYSYFSKRTLANSMWVIKSVENSASALARRTSEYY